MLRSCVPIAGRVRLARRILLAAFVAAATSAWANRPPQIRDFVVTPIPSEGGQRVRVVCLASDPDNDAISFNWSTGEGTLLNAEDHAAEVLWDLPAGEGNRMLSVEVRDAAGAFTRGERLVPIGPVYPYQRFSNHLRQPARAAVDSLGTLWVTDVARAHVVHFDPAGRFLGEFATGPRPLGIAVAADRSILVGESGLNRVARYTADGTFLGEIGAGQTEFALPGAIAVEPGTGRIHVVDSRAGVVRVFTSQGFPQSSYGAGVLEYPVAAAINPQVGEVYVADQTSVRIVVFDLSGHHLRNIGARGNEPGKFARLQDVAMDQDGLLLVLDSFHNNVQLIQPTGDPVAVFGQFGNGTGAMRTPLGLATVPGERIFVTSSGSGEVEVFGHWSWLDPNTASTGTGMVLR